MSAKGATDRSGRTELHDAARDNDVARIRTLVDSGAAISAADKEGWTRLHFAAQALAIEAGSLLIAAGAQIDAMDANGNTPLGKAVFNTRDRDGDMIRLLRKAGAHPSAVNKHGISPLSLARSIGNFDVAQFFADLP